MEIKIEINKELLLRVTFSRYATKVKSGRK